MRFIGGLLVIGLIIVAAGLAFGFIDLQKTADGRLPQVAIEEGALPKYDAKVAKIEVGREEKTVEVPTVAVNKP